MEPLGDLADHMPPIVWRGELCSYSASTALLGCWWKVLRSSLRQYIDKTSYNRSRCAVAPFSTATSSLADDLAVGYQYQNGSRPVPFLYLNIAPAAALNTTATDGSLYGATC